MDDLLLSWEGIKRRSRWNALISAFGALLVFLGLGMGAFEAHRLSIEKSKLESDVSRLRNIRAVLYHNLSEKQKTLDQFGIQSNDGDLLKARGQLSSYLGSAQVARRVFFQIRSADQLGLFKECLIDLERLGYRVPAPEIIGEHGPRVTDVRYFRKSDRSDAEVLALDLHQCISAEVSIKYIPGFENSKAVSSKHFEVFLARTL